ncbi:MAG: hypothetical protein FJ006_11565 [Chloroflexi bacterium]|nr:hypothetical protein [Chloroflexota bacterium]
MTVRTKQDAARVLADTSGDRCFFCQDGCISKNLYQLVECLDHISEDSFRHHVTEVKNDFSNWVRDVFGDDKLANNLSRCTDSTEAAKVLRDRIAWLQKKLK